MANYIYLESSRGDKSNDTISVVVRLVFKSPCSHYVAEIQFRWQNTAFRVGEGCETFEYGDERLRECGAIREMLGDLRRRRSISFRANQPMQVLYCQILRHLVKMRQQID